MSNVFNLKRAGNYFCHDLNTAKNNYLYSMLILGLMPIIIFILYELFALIFNRGQFDEIDSTFQKVMFTISVATLVITFPIKQYGRLTDKRYGSDWLMLPASTFEKWLSMVLMTCLVVPVVFLVLNLGSDWLLSVIFPNLYPDAIVSSDSLGKFLNVFNGDFADETGISVNMLGACYASWCENILIVTLGAVLFKKAKFPKTLLACTGIMIVIFFLIVMFNGFDLNINDEDFERWLGADDPQVFVRRLNVFLTTIYTVIFVLLGGGLYLRLKTLKH